MDHLSHMHALRIIPRLDVKGPNLVKGVHMEGLRVLGKPEDFAFRYYQDGADELIYIDTVASLYGRNNLLDIVKRAAGNIFIPLTAGGGIKTLDDIRELLRAGADKVAVNTHAIHNPDFIKEASRAFGSQCIVVSIQARACPDGSYEAMTDNAREKTGKDVFDWARQAVDLGAGEILLTSVDREVIASGGAGNCAHFLEAARQGLADAISAASIFHYHCLRSQSLTDRFREEGNIEFIKQGRGSTEFLKGRIEPTDIPVLKDYLCRVGVSCRLTRDHNAGTE
jgi:cyclase